MAHEGHEHGPDCNHDHDDSFEIEVVELEDQENGEKEKFAILEELEFEGRNFAILAHPFRAAGSGGRHGGPRGGPEPGDLRGQGRHVHSPGR